VFLCYFLGHTFYLFVTCLSDNVYLVLALAFLFDMYSLDSRALNSVNIAFYLGFLIMKIMACIIFAAICILNFLQHVLQLIVYAFVMI